MNKLALTLAMVATLSMGVACSNNKPAQQTSAVENTGSGTSTQTSTGDTTAKVSDDNINNALTQANLGSVKVDVDNDKKVVKLTGQVNSENEKNQAEQIAKDNSGGYVVANEVEVQPTNASNDTKKVNNKTDDAIKNEWEALSAKNNWDNQHINSDVNNGVLTLKGDVDSQSQRTSIQRAAAKIPHVRQVVNELTVKNASK